MSEDTKPTNGADTTGSVRVDAGVRRFVEEEVKARMPEKWQFAWIGPNLYGKTRGSATEYELNAVYELASELAALLNEANEGRPGAMRSA